METEMAKLHLTEIELEEQSQSRSPNLSETVPQVPLKPIRQTTCGHQPYYASGFCRKCYHPRHPRNNKKTICGHRHHFAKRLCQKCYAKEHYKQYISRPGVRQHIKEYAKEYRQRPEVKERTREYGREYYKRPGVKERIARRKKQYRIEYCQRPEVKARKAIYNNQPKYKAKRREHYQKMKREVFELLGGARCVNCGCDFFDFLEVNHKNGCSKKEQKEGRFIQSIYLRKRKTDDLNVLCRICNALDYLSKKKPKQSKRFNVIWDGK